MGRPWRACVTHCWCTIQQTRATKVCIHTRRFCYICIPATYCYQVISIYQGLLITKLPSLFTVCCIECSTRRLHRTDSATDTTRMYDIIIWYTQYTVVKNGSGFFFHRPRFCMHTSNKYITHYARYTTFTGSFPPRSPLFFLVLYRGN